MKSRRVGSQILIVLVFVIPITVYFVRPHLPALGTMRLLETAGTTFPPSPIAFTQQQVAPVLANPPRITHVQIIDFDRDGTPDIIACDAQTNSVLWYRQDEQGDWEERVLATDLVAPAHATVVDLDQDGDLDVVVSVLGNIKPDDGVVGRLVLLEQHDGVFRQQILLDDVRRVADAQPADFDGDGDLDLAVAVFGYARGSILWLENRGDGIWLDRQLHAAPGTIHVPVGDFDGDGDVDIVAVVSQYEEEVWGFENLGGGQFQSRRLFFTVNHDIGSAGLIKSDLDGDGDLDLILPVGDDLEDYYTYPQPYHGCIWLENQGGWSFEPRRIANFGGTYAAACGDIDGDGDQDVVLVSMLAERSEPPTASIVWLENDGDQNFRIWQVANQPTQLITAACGDLNGDGHADIVAGGLHIMRPFERYGRVTAWMTGGGKR